MNKYKFSEIYVDLCESFKVKITQNMIESFIDISGDDNPLHIDNEYAVKKGFKGKVVHGFLSASFYSRLVGVYIPGKKAIVYVKKGYFYYKVLI